MIPPFCVVPGLRAVAWITRQGTLPGCFASGSRIVSRRLNGKLSTSVTAPATGDPVSRSWLFHWFPDGEGLRDLEELLPERPRLEAEVEIVLAEVDIADPHHLHFQCLHDEAMRYAAATREIEGRHETRHIRRVSVSSGEEPCGQAQAGEVKQPSADPPVAEIDRDATAETSRDLRHGAARTAQIVAHLQRAAHRVIDLHLAQDRADLHVVDAALYRKTVLRAGRVDLAVR